MTAEPRMPRRKLRIAAGPRGTAVVLLPLTLVCAAAAAQPTAAPVPLYPGAGPPSIVAEPLAPPPASEPPAPPPATTPAIAAPPTGAAPTTAPTRIAPPPDAAASRMFCAQPVTVRLADPDSVPERYRKFIGIWSDASWSPSQCAALIVTSAAADGTAMILYVFGPLAAEVKTPGGVLRGTGIIRDGELKFQNSDGSQFAFRPVYADLEGRLTTPKGETFQATFKQTP